MKKILSSPLLLWILRILVGVLFIISGVVKANDVTGFSYKLEEYFYVFGEDIPFLAWFFNLMIPLSTFFAWLIPVLEIALGFALLVGFRINTVSWIIMGMLVFFALLTSYSYLSGYVPKEVSFFSFGNWGAFDEANMRVTDCGCFGDAIKFTPGQSFLKDVILIILTLPIFLYRREVKPVFEGKTPAIISLGSFVLFGLLSFYAYRHLPFVDFIKQYKVGADLKAPFSDPTNDLTGTLTDFCMECSGKDGMRGATLYIVMYNLEKKSSDANKAAVLLSREIRQKAPGIQVCAATNTPGKYRKEFLAKYPDFCFALHDEKDLKTMIRSSPGYLLLKDGKIRGKWHYHDIPSIDELQEKLK